MTNEVNSGRIAELSTIGAVLKYNDPGILSQVVAMTTTEDFHDPGARAVRYALRGIEGEFNLTSLLICLEQDGTLDDPVSPEFLEEARNLAPLPIALSNAIQSVKTFQASRKVYGMSQELIRGLPEIAGNSKELSARVDSYVTDVNDSLVGIGQSNWSSVGDIAEELMSQDDDPEEFISTGLEDVDAVLNGGAGLGVGQMITFAARPGFGKSTILLDVVRKAAENGTPCLLFSMEMRKRDLVQRLVGALTHITHSAVFKPNELTDAEQERVRQAVEKLKTLPLYIDDRSELTIQDVRSTYARLNAEVRAQGHAGIKLVGIDYLQLFSAGNQKFDSRQNEVSYYSRQVKIFAKDNDVCAIAAAQLNRGQSKDSDVEFEPKVSDLRESGQIEQDSDIIMLLGKDESEASVVDAQARGAMNLIVGKNRNGPKVKVPVTLIPHYPTFETREVIEEDTVEW